MNDESTATVTQPLVDLIVAKGLDKIRCKDVAAAIYWVLCANKCASPAEAVQLVVAAKATVSDYPPLLAELEMAHRIVSFVFNDLLPIEKFGEIFSSWLCALLPEDEVSKIHRPWNITGVPDNRYSNEDFIPLEFSPNIASGKASQGMVHSRIPILFYYILHDSACITRCCNRMWQSRQVAKPPLKMACSYICHYVVHLISRPLDALAFHKRYRWCHASLITGSRAVPPIHDSSGMLPRVPPNESNYDLGTGICPFVCNVKSFRD